MTGAPLPGPLSPNATEKQIQPRRSEGKSNGFEDSVGTMPPVEGMRENVCCASFHRSWTSVLRLCR